MDYNWKKNVVTKKLYRYSMNILRFYINNFSNPKNNQSAILANSFPKSGTHLLTQILSAFPGTRDWGNFLASTPSFTFRVVPPEKMKKKILQIIPRELVSAHLYYSDEINKTIHNKKIVHYFIYRDPRDVVISEAYYLSSMNRWHYLSKYFKRLESMTDRVSFSILGNEMISLDVDYPNIADRFMKYKEWLDKENVCPIKYEELMSDSKIDIFRKIYLHYNEKAFSPLKIDEQTFITNVIKNINPQKSHTFRSGKSGNWKTIFTKQQKDLFKQIAGDLLIELGYEKDLDW